MEERFSIIETKIAYNENNLTELNSEVFRQSRLIERLEAQLQKVTAQLRELGMDGDLSLDQKPPHY